MVPARQDNDRLRQSIIRRLQPLRDETAIHLLDRLRAEQVLQSYLRNFKYLLDSLGTQFCFLKCPVVQLPPVRRRLHLMKSLQFEDSQLEVVLTAISQIGLQFALHPQPPNTHRLIDYETLRP